MAKIFYFNFTLNWGTGNEGGGQNSSLSDLNDLNYPPKETDRTSRNLSSNPVRPLQVKISGKELQVLCYVLIKCTRVSECPKLKRITSQWLAQKTCELATVG